VRRHLLFLLASAALLPLASAEEKPEYDLLLTNGRVVDGSGNPWFKGDVAIKGDRIVAVGRVKGKAKRTIDAKGLIVAPGFIDIHSHSDYLLLEDGTARSKVHQGVTTEVLGEGQSVGPNKGELSARRAKVKGKEHTWDSIGGYFDLLEKGGTSVNVATYVGLDNVWQCVMGKSHERPTAKQLAEMEALVDEAMKDGAFGLSSMLMMPPGSLATTDDIIALAKVSAKHGGIYSSHIRHEGVDVFKSVKEAIAIGEKAGLPVDIIHLKIADQKLWGKMNEIIALIDAARKRGVDVQGHVYPYTRGAQQPRQHHPAVGARGRHVKDDRAPERREAESAAEEGHPRGRDGLVQPLHRRGK